MNAAGEGLWAYRRIPQARVHAFPNKVFQVVWRAGHSQVRPWQSLARRRAQYRRGRGHNNTEDKFARGAYDTTRQRVTVTGGNQGWLDKTALRGQITVLQIDPSAAPPTWTSLTQLCEGPSRGMADGENQTFCYDGPQLGQEGPVAPKDLFYIKPGNQSAGPGNNVEDYAARAGVLPSTPLFRSVILNPAIPSNSMRTCRRTAWNIPGLGPEPRRRGSISLTTQGIVSPGHPLPATGCGARARSAGARSNSMRGWRRWARSCALQYWRLQYRQWRDGSAIRRAGLAPSRKPLPRPVGGCTW